MDGCVRIERAENGYMVAMRDPKIVAKNAKRDIEKQEWMDPNREYVFETIEAVLKFLQANLDKALPKQDYDSAFEMMVDDDDD